jgi:hypothetical protein
MKHLRSILYVTAAFAMMLSGGCKTTEANYRQAYEKAIAARDNIDSTIYGQIRRQFNEQAVVTVSGDTVNVRVMHVRVTPDGGGIAENLHRYNVVAGQFKQLFNARSMRNRMADNGFPGAFVVETAEPYYYVVASSHNTAAEASAALKSQADAIRMKEPCPFILDATTRVR